ncbi:MAG: shikimate kinase [Desulfobulbaceae bacterium]|nr:shikimate kinase [Desulfobulbaceae bacterium]
MVESGLKIILTGYRATGKSTVGRLLARRLSIDFLDMDKEIEARAGTTIREMVASHGWPYFREMERALLAELAGRDRLVIATGGGAVIHGEEWQRLKDTGLVVWLTADPATIGLRLAGDHVTAAQRPSLTGSGTGREIESVLAQRTPLYQQGSHLAVDTVGRTLEEIAALILAALPQRTQVD